jgi:transcriptional regulator with XRE-family HTH domain
MNFQDLHERLRQELVRRIERGELTGTRLAGLTGFRQAHISNFLNRKRALSLDGLDRVLAALGLTVDQILPLEMLAAAEPELERTGVAVRMAGIALLEERVEMVPVVASSVAADEGQIGAASVIEMVPVSAARLADHRARPSPRSAGWRRFVAIRPDAQQAAAMEPVLAPGSIAVIDRHYNSLAPYRTHQPTLYAVRHGAGMVLRYVELEDRCLVLRPASLSCPVQLVALGPEEMPTEFVVGRVCLVLREF